MVTTPPKLADINNGSALVENWGRPTSYFQRWLQANNAAITTSIAGLIQVEADLQAQEAELAATVATLNATVTTLNATVTTLSNQVTFTSNLSTAIIGTGSGTGLAFSSTDANGIIEFAHGYNGVPIGYPAAAQFSMAAPAGDIPLPIYHIQIIRVDNTNIKFGCYDFTGAPIVSTGVSYVWHVAGA